MSHRDADRDPRRRGRRTTFIAALSLATLTLLSGCGFGPDEPPRRGVVLHVTRTFGQERLYSAERDRVSPGATALNLLRSNRRVETVPGDGAVQSIQGLGGGGRSGARNWSYFVNGLQGGAEPAERPLSPGDVVQWDYHRSSAAASIPMIVGAFPEPMVSGIEGDRLPVRIECADDRGRACREVERRLREAGVTASVGAFGQAGGENVLRVIVAPWSLARRVRAATRLEDGPRASGVFARFGAGGRRLELLDPSGRAARVAPPGTGLVAATAVPGQQRVWLVTGIDEAGVERAAAALDAQTLRDRFAVAALPGGDVEALPIAGPR